MAVDLGEEVLITLRRVFRAIDLHSRSLTQRYGLTVPQLVVLRQLRRLGECPGGELARNVSLSHATLTGILRRLESRGLVRRRRSETDRRRLPVRLTEAGEQLLDHAPPLLQESFVEQFRLLQDWEQTQLLASLQRMVALMEARTVDASPILTTGEIASPAVSPELPPTGRAR